jgi:hypothetical protein
MQGFLDLTLAFEFIQNPRSLRFLWRCVDVHKQGFIDKPTVAFFYRDIADGLRQEQVSAPPPCQFHLFFPAGSNYTHTQ